MNIPTFLAHQNTLGRPWTKDETKKYQIMNKDGLDEINKTLCPPFGNKTGKVGIFCPGQVGDLCTAMSVLKYADDLWPDKRIIWYTNCPNADNLKYSIVSEVRPWPWAGNGLPAGTPDFYPLLCNADNRLNKELASQYELTNDLEDGYFPTPWMIASEKQRDYPNCSKMIFGVPDEWGWHPFLSWSDEEREAAEHFMAKLPLVRKNIMLETFAGSGQSPFWDENTTRKIMQICRDKLGECNFIFASHKHKGGVDNCGIENSIFFDDIGCTSAGQFTVRQCALLNDYCDLMVCMSSGLSVATSAWGLKPIPKLQYCGSLKCSTVALANGPIQLVSTDGKAREDANAEFENKLREMLLMV